MRLKLPTRTRRGPRHSAPIWHCSGWGLAGRSVSRPPVRSYRTISPLPVVLADPSAVCFCATFRRVAPPSRYEAPCPVELGLSSTPSWTPRPPGLLTRVFYHPFGGYFIEFRFWKGSPGAPNEALNLTAGRKVGNCSVNRYNWNRNGEIRVDIVTRVFGGG